MTRGILVALVALVACRGGDPAPTPGAASGSAAGLTAADWRADLQALAGELGHHANPFFKTPEATWRARIASVDAALPSLDADHAAVALIEVAAALGDAHTGVFLPRDRPMYPIALLYFDDGVVVGGAAPDARWAVGQRVTAIDGTPIDAAIAKVLATVPAENEAGPKDAVPGLLIDPTILAGTDVTRGRRATYTLANGRTLELAPSATHVYLEAPQPRPLHLDGPTHLGYWNKYVDAQRLLYLQYNRCGDDPRVGPFASFAAATLAYADRHPVDRFVIDLRGNGGGNSRVIEPLFDGLAARPALAGRVFVLIGRTTFSSAMLNAIAAKRQLHATLVGTPTGGNPNGYGEIEPFTLPRSHLAGQYSTKLFSDPTYTGTTVPPDVLVHVTSADWFGGRDPAMDAVLAAPLPP